MHLLLDLNISRKQQNRPKPTVEEWVDFAQAFDLPNLILHYNRAVRRGGADQAILDIILRHYSASFLAADNETIASAEVGLGNEASDDEQGQPTIRIHEISVLKLFLEFGCHQSQCIVLYLLSQV